MIGCNRKKEKFNNYQIKNTSNEIENFNEFNIRFHTDSIFQLARVNFPIGGKSINGFKKHDWTLKNWEMMKNLVVETSQMKDYKHSLTKSDTLIVEKFWIPESGFEVERKFKRINNKWFLIYYNDVNL
ncbi:hypothetical protein ASE21_07000 [Flavobacterium sp. Root901]|nr:hypothetical protein ASE21_07000 [Flavobacterium sp. Root901]